VIGEVVKPARYELKSRTTVLDVLAIATTANHLAGEHLNFYLMPGDIVLVP